MEASAKPTTYEPDEVEAKLKEHGLDEWYLEGDWIRRKYNTDGWPTTLMVVNAVGFVCEPAQDRGACRCVAKTKRQWER